MVSQLPTVIVSSCLLGTQCRFDGSAFYIPSIPTLLSNCVPISVCPELLVGYAIPRDPVEQVGNRAMTVKGVDETSYFEAGARQTLQIARRFGVKYALLKSGSPSCGPDLVYDGTFSNRLVKGMGFTAKLLNDNGIRVFSENNVDELIALIRGLSEGDLDDLGLKHDVEEIDDKTYASWQMTCVRCSDEKERVEPVLRNIVNNLRFRRNFLDVGPGDGDLTFRVARYFENTVVVEPNQEVREVFESRGAQFIGDYFENVDLGNRVFDFILCSHVFWLVKKEERRAFIKKMLSHLAGGGILSIVMMAPQGQCHDYHQRFFYKYDMTSHDVLQDLHALGLDVSVKTVPVKIQTSSFDDFFSICKLFAMQSWLHPANRTRGEIVNELGDLNEYTRRKLGEIGRYIRATCFKDGIYSMDMHVDVMAVRSNRGVGREV